MKQSKCPEVYHQRTLKALQEGKEPVLAYRILRSVFNVVPSCISVPAATDSGSTHAVTVNLLLALCRETVIQAFVVKLLSLKVCRSDIF